MTSRILKASLIKSGLAASVLLFASGLAQASNVTLTAAPQTTTLPDGQTVPMWGYTCGDSLTIPVPSVNATCTAMNGDPQTSTTWQPPLITVPSGQDLTITLVNALDFGVDDQEIPTSLVIDGQLGGGLGAPTAMGTLVGGLHGAQGTTWPGTQGTPGACDEEGTFCPPAQADRVRSFGTEVLANGSAPLVWTAANLRPGTYLIHSGTQPSIQHSMGLYGVLVVTDAAYPGATFDEDVALLLSEIDPVLNAEVAQVVKNTGFSDTFVWSGQVGACGDVTQPATAHTCYPPVVNYSPLYYLINGVSFDRSNSGASALDIPAGAAEGRVLLRFVNAGLRMHVPSVVGADMTLHAEDGNILPGVPKLQNQVFLAAGKTYDVTIQPKQTIAGTYDPATFAVYDRALGLSTNNQRDGGMQAHLLVAGGAAPASTAASATGETYFCVAGTTLAVADASKGVLANDVGAYGATEVTNTLVGAASPLFTLQSNGTFTYRQLSGETACGGTFDYLVNGTVAGTATITQCDALTQGTGCTLGVAPTAANDSYTSNIASRLQISPAGVLVNDTDPSGLPLKVDLASVIETEANLSLDWNPNGDGSFIATATAPGTYAFTYKAKNTQNRLSATAATVTLTFPAPSGLVVALIDGKTGDSIDPDYRWIIEEDRTFYIDPKCQVNQRPMNDSNGNPCPALPVPSLATNFHTSHTPVVAQGCVGTVSCEAGQTRLNAGVSEDVVCDLGNGDCRPGTQRTPILPGEVALDPNKRYYISILPRDAWITSEEEDAFGYTMGGAPISSAQVAAGPATTINVYLQKTPLETAKISVFVFQDDSPLNGEHDAGGGTDTLAPNEAGLGGFNLVLLDKAGMFGDAAGQITYDMAGMPVSNSLAGTIDPITGEDACPISPTSTDGLVGVIVTCPKYESDGTTLSPLAGHAIIANMYAGFYEVVAAPGADRIARGEKWLQTNTLDGTKGIEAFLKPGEPGYFQEFGPGGYHVTFGMANPDIINGRKAEVCASAGSCTGNFYGNVTALRMSRTPDQRVYGSGSYAMYGFGQAYVSLGAPDSDDFAFTTADDEGNFQFNGVPTGNLRVTVFDQWNDLLVDGLSTPIKAQTAANAGLLGGSDATRMEIPVTQWRANLSGRVFLDVGCGADPDGIAGDGVSQECEPGLPLAPFNIRYRDGSYAAYNNTDLVGNAGFNEVFPFLNWLVVDIDSARHKLTGIHVVYDAGGPVDGNGGGTSAIGAEILNSTESPTAHLPANLRFPGARYCANADCTGTGSFNPASGNPGSTGRVDPGWVTSEGWQGLLGQYSVLEFAMKPFLPNENGGIKGLVTYAPTRPFDDPALLFQLAWAPGIANVTVNLYREDTAADGTKTLKRVDTTTSSSWDDWAQGFRSGNVPNMNCPGQETTSPFYFTLENSRQWLNPSTPIAANSRFKCFDGWPMHNQVQPAQYNGMYKFPSVTARNPSTGAPTATNCTGCILNTAVPPTDPDYNTPMLRPGKYVVEVIVPPGYELVKEEDRNILMGDAYTAAVTQQVPGGIGNIFIMPDQAAINAFYNPYNVVQPLTNNGASPMREGDTGSIEVFWPCVGQTRIVPDFASLFPASEQMAAFAGASRPLCDRKAVTLNDQMSALVKFYLFTSTDIASHFTGQITNDLAAEFDPFSPQFGEKLGVPNVPVAFRDFTGKEISRVYADQWGRYNGVTFSSWTVWPPSPSGFVPQMMITCMNDPGPIPDPANPGQMITDPMFNPAYSNFCYESPFMPGQTAHMDTPVLPTMGFAGGYNLPDTEYPDTTPAIKSVHGPANSGLGGPYVAAAGETLTITALGNKQVLNHAYSGPQAVATAACPSCPQKFITRHYGFGSAAGTVTIGGVTAPIVGPWADGLLTVTVPAGVPACAIQQRNVPGTELCGQLEITAANGKKSIDTVTVTIGGKAPTYINGENQAGNALQLAIDNAEPGDLIMVGPGNYKEMLLMWKPVRLQGVGAASVTLNADAHPAGRLDPWRHQVVCLFGLTLEGRPSSGPYSGCPASMLRKVDRIPREPILGWDVTGNGNLAQLLQEPTLMGAYEGAGITVLGKGANIAFNAGDPGAYFGADAEGDFPAGSLYLTNSTANCNANVSNFLCNPSRIDGISITNSSQGGGGIFVHGWGHGVEISNNRVFANHGTGTGGIQIGTGEHPPGFIAGGPDPIFFPVPGGTPNGTQLGYGFNKAVRVHHNSVTANASIGDSLYSATPSAAGGVSFNAGSDNFLFKQNWVAGNLSSGDGGGVTHAGFIVNNPSSVNEGIRNNWILFNQSASATLPTHGGGLAILGAAVDRILANGDECGTVDDADCPPGLSAGVGPGLVIDGNLVMGNSAESGSGGGIRLQRLNGDEVAAFPTNPGRWYEVTLTNNMIANNVAGWDGGGVSMQDALKVRFINNTIVSNDTTASAGVLFNTLGAGLGSVPGPGDNCPPNAPSCTNPPVLTSTNQPAGLVTMRNTPNLIALMTAPNPLASCPGGYGYSGADCRVVSRPLLTNNLFWQNRAFHIEVGALGGGQQNQQAVVTLVPSLDQTISGPTGGTGFCDLVGTNNGAPGSGGPVNYWDIGVRGDTGPTNHGSGFTLNPTFSVLTSTSGYAASNISGNPLVVSQYCNGSRLPPEGGGLFHGFNTPPGRSESTGLYPVFALNQVTAAATIDEGNNWINLSYGPLALSNAATAPPSGTMQAPLGNYDLSVVTSPAVSAATASGAPDHDFFGRARPLGAGFDIGAAEFFAAPVPPPAFPTLAVLDTFNRANANTLGGNWQQLVALSNAGIRVNSNQAFCINSGLAGLLCLGGVGANAYWNPTVFGARQAAAFTFANTTVDTNDLYLKASGGFTLGTYENAIRVRYNAGQVTVESTTNFGASFTTAGTFAATFANGNTLTALADASGNVFVWQTVGATTTFLGQAATGVTGSGRIGLHLASGARVDNFAGGNVP